MAVRDYVATLRALLPPGRAWNRERHSRTDDVLTAIGDELGRVDGRAGDLMREIDPRTTTELLDEWESELGLPGECITDPAASTDEERRGAIIAQLLSTGRQDEQYFIDILAGFGVTATIVNEMPFEMGISGMGDPVGGSEWRHVWRIVTGDDVSPAMVEAIKCAINRYKPAHTVVLYDFEFEMLAATADQFHQIMNVDLPTILGEFL